VPCLVIGDWVQYIDQPSLTNAYVRGMKENMSFNGNEVMQLKKLFTLRLVPGQIPLSRRGTWYMVHLIPQKLHVMNATT
jgi:hypothetical protein